MNFDWYYMIEQMPLYKKALLLTLKIGLWGILLSLIIGLACSIIQHYRVKVIRHIIKWYIEISRNTPLLIQLFFLYYGLPKIGITMEAETCAIVGLAFLGGSYMSEAFRSGIEAVPISQIESGKSIGLSKIQLTRYITLPQAVSFSIPALGANCLFLLKETSIFSGIALLELTNTTKYLIGMYYKTNESLLMLVIGYIIILLPISLILNWLERRVRYAEFGN